MFFSGYPAGPPHAPLGLAHHNTWHYLSFQSSTPPARALNRESLSAVLSTGLSGVPFPLPSSLHGAHPDLHLHPAELYRSRRVHPDPLILKGAVMATDTNHLPPFVTTDISSISLALLVLGAYVCLVGQVSYFLKERLFMSSALISLCLGIG